MKRMLLSPVLGIVLSAVPIASYEQVGCEGMLKSAFQPVNSLMRILLI